MIISLQQTQNNLDKYEEERLHMERLLKFHLVELNLPLRILIRLEKAGIRTIGDLTKCQAKQLCKINGVGQLSVEKLTQALESMDLSLTK